MSQRRVKAAERSLAEVGRDLSDTGRMQAQATHGCGESLRQRGGRGQLATGQLLLLPSHRRLLLLEASSDIIWAWSLLCAIAIFK